MELHLQSQPYRVYKIIRNQQRVIYSFPILKMQLCSPFWIFTLKDHHYALWIKPFTSLWTELLKEGENQNILLVRVMEISAGSEAQQEQMYWAKQMMLRTQYLYYKQFACFTLNQLLSGPLDWIPSWGWSTLRFWNTVLSLFLSE